LKESKVETYSILIPFFFFFFFFFFLLIFASFSLLLDNIGRLESMNRTEDESDSDLYSDLSDTDDDLDGKE
jgi:hypothetical protein